MHFSVCRKSSFRNRSVKGFGLVVSEALWKGCPSSPVARVAFHSSLTRGRADSWWMMSRAALKGLPVVAGRAGGIPLQLDAGEGGFLVDDVEGCAERTLWLRHPGEARVVGLPSALATSRRRRQKYGVSMRLKAVGVCGPSQIASPPWLRMACRVAPSARGVRLDAGYRPARGHHRIAGPCRVVPRRGSVAPPQPG